MAIKSQGQITIVDVTDAYSIMLTSEVYTFVGGTGGVGSGQTCTTEAVAFCGSNQCSSVTVTAADIVCPNGISAKVENSGTSKVKITFTTTATISSDCEATIPINVEGVTVNKKFSFAVAKTGATGATGAAGVSIKGVKNMYLASASNSGVSTSTTGWTETMQTTDTTKKYLWSYQVISYSSGSPTNTVPTIIGTHGATGATGAAGADAITVTITSSNGTIFKNNSGSTVLTAHVFKGAVEQTVAENGVCGSLGTIKWYKDGGTTAVATAKTYTVAAANVTNSSVVTCQLEV